MLLDLRNLFWAFLASLTIFGGLLEDAEDPKPGSDGLTSQQVAVDAEPDGVGAAIDPMG